MVRYGLLGLAAAVAVLAVLPVFRPADASLWRACEAEPDTQCLIDLAVARMRTQTSLPGYSHTARDLARLGRYDDALAVGVRVWGPEATPSQTDLAERTVALYRLTAALRGSEDLPTVLARNPLAESQLYISALDLLGRNPSGAIGRLHGVPDCSAPAIPADRLAPLVREMAGRIIAVSASGNPNQRAAALRRAAELYAELGDRDAALEALARLPRDAEHVVFAPALVRLIGAETALGLYRAAGGDDPRVLRHIAAEEPDPVRAAEHLEVAFAAFAGRSPAPDYDEMARTVQVSAERGLAAQAEDLARQLEHLAETVPGVFPVFPHIAVAEALLAAGASPADISRALARAEAQAPGAAEVMGIGAVAGPIQWGRSGLGREAALQIAAVYRQIGDASGAARALSGLEDPPLPWEGQPLAALAVSELEAQLAEAEDGAEAVTPAADMALHRAHLAARLADAAATPAQQAWARATTANLLRTQDPATPEAFAVFEALLRAGIAWQDQEVSQAVLAAMATAALASRDARDMVQAGVALAQFDAGCF